MLNLNRHLFLVLQKITRYFLTLIYSLCCFSGRKTNELLSYVFHECGKILSTEGCFASDHPLHDLKNEMLSILHNVTGRRFEELLEHCDGTAGSDWGFLPGFESHKPVAYRKSIFSAMKKSSSFVLTDAALTVPEEITRESTVGMRYLVISRFYDSEGEINLSKMGLDKQRILDALKKMLSNDHYECVKEGDLSSSTASQLPFWTNSSEVAHLARNKSRLKRKTDSKPNSESIELNCTCETLAQRYLNNIAPIRCSLGLPLEFFNTDTLQVLKKRSNVVILCGSVKQEVLELTEHKQGWLMLINLDVFAMVRYKISDIRLLSSVHLKWEQQSNFAPQPVCLILQILQSYS